MATATSTNTRLVYDVDISFENALDDYQIAEWKKLHRDGLIDQTGLGDGTMFRLMFDSLREAQTFKFPASCTIIAEQEIVEVQDPAGGWDEVSRMDCDIQYGPKRRQPRQIKVTEPQFNAHGQMILVHIQKGYEMRNYVVPAAILKYLEENGRSTLTEMSRGIVLDVIESDTGEVLEDDDENKVSGISRGTIVQALDAMLVAGLVGWQDGDRKGSKVWSVNVGLTKAEDELYQRIVNNEHTSVRVCRPKGVPIPKGYKVPKHEAPKPPTPPKPKGGKPKGKGSPGGDVSPKERDVRTVYEIEAACSDASLTAQTAFFKSMAKLFAGEISVDALDCPEGSSWFRLIAVRLEDAQTVYDVFGKTEWPEFFNMAVLSSYAVAQHFEYQDEDDDSKVWVEKSREEIDLSPRGQK